MSPGNPILWFSCAMLLCFTRGNAAKPNIVLLMADDFGYECVSANGGKPYHTPQLDRLAEEGLRFDNCVAQPLCTPSRVKLMTGQYNFRNYKTFGTLDAKAFTFGHLMRDAGYATCIAGKWQLGRDRKLIGRFGFDQYCLWWLEEKSARYNNVGKLIQNGKVLPGKNGKYGPDVVSDFLLQFISDHKEEPFFCYYPMILTHSPFEPPPASKLTRNDPALDRMAAMVSYTDTIVGKIDEHLRKLGIRDNTVLLFTGDNGTDRSIRGAKLDGKDWPGGKGCNFIESGMRVPLIVSYPAGGVKGMVFDDPVDLADFFPTLAELAHAKIPAGQRIDGHSFAGRITGKESYEPHPWAYVGYYGKKRGPMSHFVRDTRFKLYEGGYFFDFRKDPMHEHPIHLESADEETLSSYRVLQNALEKLKSQIPAGDQYTGARTSVIDTKPGLANLRRKLESQAARE